MPYPSPNPQEGDEPTANPSSEDFLDTLFHQLISSTPNLELEALKQSCLTLTKSLGLKQSEVDSSRHEYALNLMETEFLEMIREGSKDLVKPVQIICDERKILHTKGEELLYELFRIRDSFDTSFLLSGISIYSVAGFSCLHSIYAPISEPETYSLRSHISKALFDQLLQTFVDAAQIEPTDTLFNHFLMDLVRDNVAQNLGFFLTPDLLYQVSIEFQNQHPIFTFFAAEGRFNCYFTYDKVLSTTRTRLE